MIHRHARQVELDRDKQPERALWLLICPGNNTVRAYRKVMKGKGWMLKPVIMQKLKTKAVDILGVLTRLKEHKYVDCRYTTHNGHRVLEWIWIAE